jgi:hypothetical protein
VNNWSSEFWTNGYNGWPNGQDSEQCPYWHTLCQIMVDHIKNLDNAARIMQHIGSYYVVRGHINEYLDDNIHRDYYDKKYAWSGVFHIIGDSGDTIFYPNFHSNQPAKCVNFRPGRLIIFPSLYAHRAGRTNLGSLRLVHTVRLLIETNLNKNYLLEFPYR